nr:immunoglobulin light chain junction region [Macaca mulatta]MOV78374.1 immunoglobulin light chain junction region [Macaca mulatta]MOV78771.1 immunoglobulin light chain junction region [Macaca mulatta]MOV78956.1 immunoglobulin light chain junction region [Macaca mulatta]MOV79341.1 immunoglobulin light chain junction region [Macaca mulatta]
CQQGYSYPWTF